MRQLENATWRTIFLVIYHVTLIGSNTIDGRLFQQDLKHLANDILGLAEFQRHIDKETYVDSTLDGAHIAAGLAATLETKFQQRLEVVNNLKSAIEELYAGSQHTAQPETCCDVTLIETDERFGQGEVDLDKICTGGPGVENRAFLSDKITDVMKKNLQNSPTIKWQYFGSEDGYFANYPASRFCSSSYDPRFRPWYVETATPEPKDVVIIIDTSASMTAPHANTRRIDIAIDAATTVIDTLNPNDRVGVVSFGTSVRLPPGQRDTSTCYDTELALATPANKKYLSEFVHHLVASGQTYYMNALNAAFDYFTNSLAHDMEFRNRDRVILFLTDGAPTDSSSGILDTLSHRNAEINNTVVMLTYAIGGVDDQILQNMANQVNSNSSYGEITVGVYTKVEDLDNLRYAMASFYNFFSRSAGVRATVFTVSYIDAFGIGLVTAACLPVYKGTKLMGVTCLDISMADLLSDVTYFHQGELSYAFLIDRQGRLLMHPLLPRPGDVEDDPIYIIMTTLETKDKAKSVMDKMKRGISGNTTMTSIRVRARGNVDLEGVIWNQIQSEYYWLPIEGTNFAICVVLGQNDRQANLEWSKPFSESFIYHRLDFSLPKGSCAHFGRLALKDLSTVKFTADAFVKPFVYLDMAETKNDVDSYTNYMVGATSTNPGFKDSVRRTVSMTAIFGDILSNSNTLEHAMWLYIGTEDGVFRIIPGVRMPKMFDHKLRPWYAKTIGQKGLYTVSTPYDDAFGAGLVITLGHVIYEGRPDGQHNENDLPIGAMAMDLPMLYIYSLLLSRFPICKEDGNECFVLDSSGFIVVNQDFITSSDIEDVENIHITVREAYIAESLIQSQVMVKLACANYGKLRYQFSWIVHLKSRDQGSKVTPDYEIHAVEGSNIFVVVKKYIGQKPASCFCQTNRRLSAIGTCPSNSNQQSCECPCYRNIKYNYCSGDFEITSDDWPPCTPRSPDIDYEKVHQSEETVVKTLPACVDYKCQEKHTPGNCTSVVTCFWCEADSGNDKDSRCTTQEECLLKPTNGKNYGWIAGVVIGILVAVAAGCATVFCLKRKGKLNCDKQRSIPSAPPADPPTLHDPPPAYHAANPTYPPHPSYPSHDYMQSPDYIET